VIELNEKMEKRLLQSVSGNQKTFSSSVRYD